MSMSNYLENATLDHIFGKTALTQPTIYVGLSTTTPAEDGTLVTEPTEASYARVATTGTSWNAAATGTGGLGEIANATTISFAEAAEDWAAGSDLTNVVLYDAPTAGNLLFHGLVQTPRSVLSGDTAKMETGQLKITLD